MKTDTLMKWVRRSVILALGACIVAGVTGCFDDDDDAIPAGWARWQIDWTNDTSGVNPVNILLPVDDLNLLDGQMEQVHFDPYTLEVAVNGANITVAIWDWQGQVFQFNASGTITSPTTANGNYNGTDSNNQPIGGQWTVVKL